MRLRAAFALATTAAAASTSPAYAESWTLLVQPAPYSQNPAPYNSWLAYRQFSDLEACLDIRMTLHYDLWESDMDMSMRTLAGVCRSDSSGQIVERIGNDDGS